MDWRVWWCLPLIPALGNERRVAFCEFKPSLAYRELKTPAGLGRKVLSLSLKKEKRKKKKRKGGIKCCLRAVKTAMIHDSLMFKKKNT